MGSASQLSPVGAEDKPTRSELSEEQGQADFQTVRTPWRNFSESDLTPERLLSIIGRARQGHPASLLDLAERILERDLHVRSVLQTRQRAIAGVPVHVKPFSKDAADLRVAEAVQKDIVDRPNFRRLRRALTDGIFKGYSVAEIIWDSKTNPGRWLPNYQWRWPQFFGWDRATGTRIGLRTQTNATEGEPLKPFKWICHAPMSKTGLVVRSGLVYPIAAYHLFKSADVRAWISLGEVHGIPWRVGKITGESTEGDRETFLQALIALGQDASILLPPNLQLEVKDALAATGSAEFHEKFWRTMNQEISKGILGQTMTTEDGASLSQAQVHERVRQDILDADVLDLDDTIQEQLVASYVELNFGPGVPLPTLQGVNKRSEDPAVVAKSLKDTKDAIGRALPVKESELRERTGWSDPEEGDRLADGQIMGPNGPEPDPNAPEPPPTPVPPADDKPPADDEEDDDAA